VHVQTLFQFNKEILTVTTVSEGYVTFVLASVSFSAKVYKVTRNLFVLYNNEANYYKEFFSFQNLSVKVGLCPPWRTRKKPFEVIYELYKIKQSHWLLCVAKNCDWFERITPLGTFSNDDENVDDEVYDRSRPGTGRSSTAGIMNSLAAL